MGKGGFMRLGAAALLMMCAPLAAADERQDLETLRATTLKLIQLLVSEGLLSQEKANALIREAQGAPVAPGEKPKPVVRVPYVPENVKQEIKDQLREEVMAQAKAERWADPGRLPEWADRVTIEGDVRLRAESDKLDPNNAPAAFFQAQGQNINNTTEDTERLRLRARLGFRASVAEGVETGFQLATGSSGSTGNPTSVNNTLGDSFNRQSAGIDLAYVTWRPDYWLMLSGGRIRNPFFASDLVWAPDLNFDGIVASVRPLVREDLRPYFTVGAFPLKYNEPDPTQPVRKNKWLYGTQLGLDYGRTEGTLLRLGAAYYDYHNIEGIPNTDPLNPNLYDWTAPQFRQRGNTLFPINLFGNPTLFGLASQFQIVNLTAEVGLRYDDLRRASFLVDWAKNIGFDSNEIAQRTAGIVTDLPAKNVAVQYRAGFGHRLIERWGDWFAYGAYKRVEANAVLDAFVEGDFNLGGTNAKGWILGGGYGVARNSWIGLKYTTANQIDGPPLAIDTLMLDFNARF